MTFIQLNNGVRLPQLGFGTLGQAGEQVTENVAFALNHGYQLIDTANRYGNEVEVGRGLKKSGKKREDFYVETKLGPTLYENDRAIDATLARLDVGYIDLMVLHHPVNNYIYAYRMLEKAYRAGKLRAIGLSNFPVDKIRQIMAECEIAPALMQVECHPYYPAEHAKLFCDEQGIALQSWYPLGHGNAGLLQDPVLEMLAQMHQKTTAQIILRWHIQMGFGPVPGSSSPDHIRQNADIFDFSLTDEDMARIAVLNKHEPFYKVTEESLRRMATTKCNFEV